MENVKYEWGKDTSRRPWWRLRPVGTPSFHVLCSIATVRPTIVERGSNKLVRRYKASYIWPHSTGNASEKYTILNSVPAAKRWVESELAKFWEPPGVVGAQ